MPGLRRSEEQVQGSGVTAGVRGSSVQHGAPSTPPISRRAFVKAGAAGTLTAASWNQVHGANERIGIGLIGYGLIGQVHVRSFMSHADAQIRAVAETFGPRLEAAAAAIRSPVARHRDFRRMLDSKDVDAVVVATPDHWHALMTMMACAAGKDVYVEKPLGLFVREGRWMVEVARRHKRVVQVGTQGRSGKHMERARNLIRGGRLGQIVSVECSNFRNVSPGFGSPPDRPPPPGLDWDLWLGPAPLRPYNPNRGLYHFRWFWDYSGGQMTNLGQHLLDTVYWIMDLQGPTAVSSAGGRLFLKDNCEVPDTQDAILEYPGFSVICQFRECAASATKAKSSGLAFYGTRGAMPISRESFQIIPDRKEDPTNVVARMYGGHPVGGPQPVPDQPALWTEAVTDASGSTTAEYVDHARNFLDCIKSRHEPVCDVQRGHRVATACHLANIALRTGRKIRWDADKEEILDDREAAGMLVRPYRQPWDAELRALGVG
jgi:predicted dehydrogenase